MDKEDIKFFKIPLPNSLIIAAWLINLLLKLGAAHLSRDIILALRAS